MVVVRAPFSVYGSSHHAFKDKGRETHFLFNSLQLIAAKTAETTFTIQRARVEVARGWMQRFMADHCQEDCAHTHKEKGEGAPHGTSAIFLEALFILLDTIP